MDRVGLVVVGKDADDLRQFCLDHVLGAVSCLVLVDNGPKPRGYGVIGNVHLAGLGVEVLGICHADTGFGPGSVAALAQAAAGGALAGVVGRQLEAGYRWSNGDGDGPGPVSTLDGCALFFRTDLGLRFDTATFDGLHCCVEDLCLEAGRRGLEIVVPAANASHKGQSTALPDWQADYWRYRYVLGRKWKDVPFSTT